MAMLPPWKKGQEICKEISSDLLHYWTNISNCLPLNILLYGQSKSSFVKKEEMDDGEVVW